MQDKISQKMTADFRQFDSSRVDVDVNRVATEKDSPSVSYEGSILVKSDNISRPPCIHHLFELYAEKMPASTALIFEDCRLTYEQLNERANVLAHHLISLGVTCDAIVGIYVERSIEMVVGILAILKAGGAYLPLDPDYPIARVEYILQNADPKVVLTQQKYKKKINFENANVFVFDDEQIFLCEGYSKENPVLKSLSASNLVYVIYTSGSTGEPKGVMIEHGSLVNRIKWMEKEYGCDKSDVILQKTPFSFDVSVWEFFLPITNGASIVLAKPNGHKDPIYLIQLIQREGVTKIHFVPSMLNAMLSSTKLSECSSLKQVFCSGESLMPAHVDTFYKQGIYAELHNLYGPTEASIDVSYWRCSPHDATRNSVPIGMPISNTQLYILDNELKSIPQGEIGELFIGGVGLARGYLHRPQLTAERFIIDPFGTSPSARLYKTGDLCRFLADGSIEFVGRIDHQIKIRGFRVEIGEIENILMKNAAIKEATVISKSYPEGGVYLIAYIVSNDEINKESLNLYLERFLPEYMLPSFVVKLSEMPLTASGKVDKNFLLKMDNTFSVDVGAQLMESMSYIQHEIYKIWKGIIGHGDFFITDDLFKVGGDSISAIKIFSAINKEFGVNIYLEELFSGNNFSIKWLAELVEKYQINSVGKDAYEDLLNEIENMSEKEMERLLLQ